MPVAPLSSAEGNPPALRVNLWWCAGNCTAWHRAILGRGSERAVNGQHDGRRHTRPLL